MRVRLLGWLSAGLLVAGAALVTSEQAAAQAGEPYKLGTFSIDGRPTVGVVLRDSIVIDLAAANRDYETKNASAAKVQSPADMKDLIVRYDSGVSQRIKQIVAGLVAAKQLDGSSPSCVRPERVGGQDAPADHLSRQEPECGGQLLRPRGRDRHTRGTEEGSGRTPEGSRRARICSSRRWKAPSSATATTS